MTDAVINLLKPPGMTSHDAVSFVRRIFRQKRVGHSGTLDPAAAGVLPVYLGNATRLVEYGDHFDKEYRAEIIFGYSTDTGDDTGKVLDRRPVTPAHLESLAAAVSSFAGLYMQVPPMYSALKVNGRKLYELAREGKEVERPSRQVEIQAIRLLCQGNDRALIQAVCSKGTYIRTLCEDIGTRIGVPATMGFLLRTRVGPFKISQAATLEEIADLPENALLPADLAVSHFPACTFGEQDSRLLKQGRSLEIPPEALQSPHGSMARLYTDNGVFFGIGQISAETGRLNPCKIFADGNEKNVID
jgi:tRNA pseudouridine55 synthase